MTNIKNISLLGSTGSIGLNTLEVIKSYSHKFKLVALAAHSQDEVVLRQVEEYRPEAVCLVNEEACDRIRKKLTGGVKLFSGSDGLKEIAKWPTGDMVVAATSGSSSLVPVLEAIRCGKDIALANKEILVMAGRIIMEAVREHRIQFLPVDSEHNAIFQCLQGRLPVHIRQILLTGSGGPLREMPFGQFRGLKKEFVIRHPKWSMGKKISVDSATMMNKGLETIEAQWLFGVRLDQIKIMIHPEAVIHSMVEFLDGSIIAQMGPTDMKSPLLHALSFPQCLNAPNYRVPLTEVGTLRLMEPNLVKFPCLKHAMKAAAAVDSTLPCVLNAADEVAVNAFLNDKIDFADIPDLIGKVLDCHDKTASPDLKQILETDQWTRNKTMEVINGRRSVERRSRKSPLGTSSGKY
jgi:1-deoxy-D-xylulose-5-phosphate reductoisomerase